MFQAVLAGQSGLDCQLVAVSGFLGASKISFYRFSRAGQKTGDMSRWSGHEIGLDRFLCYGPVNRQDGIRQADESLKSTVVAFSGTYSKRSGVMKRALWSYCPPTATFLVAFHASTASNDASIKITRVDLNSVAYPPELVVFCEAWSPLYSMPAVINFQCKIPYLTLT